MDMTSFEFFKNEAEQRFRCDSGMIAVTVAMQDQ